MTSYWPTETASYDFLYPIRVNKGSFVFPNTSFLQLLIQFSVYLRFVQELDDVNSAAESDFSEYDLDESTSTNAVSSDIESSNNSDSNSDSDNESADETIPNSETAMVTSKDGTVWNKIVNIDQPGRFQAQNVFTARSETTGYCRNVTTPLQAFRLIFDDGFLRHIKKCTISFARLENSEWNVTDSELDVFLGLIYLRGSMNAHKYPLDLLWSDRFGRKEFNDTMPRNRFREIKKYIRFDNRATRRERLADDKFALMSRVLNRIVENSQKCFIPQESLTIDEQLFPTKSRCRFTQYMPNKPDKFGIKFWILADLKTKYCLNVQPYLGKDESRVESLGTHVVLKLMEPYYGKGYNVTTDNFFTSKQFAEELLKKRTSIVGTVRLNRRELPNCAPMPLYESNFFSSGSLNLVKYQTKKNKTVAVLSTLHKGAARDADGKKKPESILYYNANKSGVDMLDSMCRQMTTKSGCRRWTLAVFFNILDLAAVNSWIVYKEETGDKITRRSFLHTLSEQLKESAVAEKNDDHMPSNPKSGNSSKRIRCQIKRNCKRNLTSTTCTVCHNPVCGQCMANICKSCS